MAVRINHKKPFVTSVCYNVCKAKDGVTSGERLTIVPGMNTIPKDIEKEVLAAKDCKDMVAAGVFVVVEHGTGKNAPTVPEMLEIISQTTSVEELEKIIAEDKRAGVIKAANEQLEIVKKTARGENQD